MSRRWKQRLAIPAVLLAATIACVVLFPPNSTVFIIGWGLFGIALVFLVSYAFLAIGEGEDRAREREQQRRPR